MPINPAIAMGVRGLELPDPLEQYSRFATIQNAQQQNALANMQLEEYGRARAEEEEIRNRLAGGASLESPETRNFLLGSKTGRGILKSQDEALSARYKAAGERFGAIKAQTELQRGFLAQIDPEDPNAVSKLMAFHQGNHTGPLGEFLAQVGVKPDQGSAEIAALQGQPPEAIRAFINRSAQGVEAFNSKLMEVSPGATLIDPRTRQPVYTAPTKPEASPADVRAYEYAVSQGYKGSFMDFKAAQRPPGTTNIQNVQAFAPASVEAQKQYVQNVGEERKTLREAPNLLASIDEARKLIPGAKGFMGAGGEPLLKAASFLNNRLGLSIDTKGVTDATVLRTRLFDGILANLKKLDSQPSQEQQRIMQESLGNLGTDPQALERILDATEAALRTRVDLYNADVKDAESRGVKFPFNPVVNLPPPAKKGAGVVNQIPGRQAPATPSRTVVRTGTLNGRRVVEYSDGKTEYAD